MEDVAEEESTGELVLPRMSLASGAENAKVVSMPDVLENSCTTRQTLRIRHRRDIGNEEMHQSEISLVGQMKIYAYRNLGCSSESGKPVNAYSHGEFATVKDIGNEEMRISMEV